MQLSDFHFDLPDELIAQTPLSRRSDSRLLVQTGSDYQHARFSELPDILAPGDHLVFNDTRVIAARLFGQKLSGGKIELLIERVVGADELLTKIRASKSPKPDSEIVIFCGNADGAVPESNQSTATIGETLQHETKANGHAIDEGSRQSSIRGVILSRSDDLFRVKLSLPAAVSIDAFIQSAGQLPLPPYIQRQPEPSDAERYQTVYAKNPGAVAAPTAGLHFDDALFEALAKRNITHSFVTLHVGAGTFMPVRVKNISEHVMHPERATVSEQTVRDIQAAKERGGRVIAVGTTCVRTLEAASLSGDLIPFSDETRLFLKPGATFNTVDGMITNFHLPESTLLMLVCAFGGYTATMQAYQSAVQRQYRFFSYGDAMLVWPNTQIQQAI